MIMSKACLFSYKIPSSSCITFPSIPDLSLLAWCVLRETKLWNIFLPFRVWVEDFIGILLSHACHFKLLALQWPVDVDVDVEHGEMTCDACSCILEPLQPHVNNLMWMWEPNGCCRVPVDTSKKTWLSSVCASKLKWRGFLFYFGENDSSSLCYFCAVEGIMTFLVLYTRKSFWRSVPSNINAPQSGPTGTDFTGLGAVRGKELWSLCEREWAGRYITTHTHTHTQRSLWRALGIDREV